MRPLNVTKLHIKIHPNIHHSLEPTTKPNASNKKTIFFSLDILIINICYHAARVVLRAAA